MFSLIMLYQRWYLKKNNQKKQNNKNCQLLFWLNRILSPGAFIVMKWSLS